MTDGEELDSRNVTFSQAQGYEALPGPLALGEISKEARTKLWDLLAALRTATTANEMARSADDGLLNFLPSSRTNRMPPPSSAFSTMQAWACFL